MAERQDSIHWSTRAYGKERYEKQAEQSTHKKLAHKSKKKFNNNGSWAEKKEQKKKGVCLTCGSVGHMTKDCPNKKNKGKAKPKKEATSNLTTKISEYDEVYINTLEFESYAASKSTCPTTINAHHVLEGTTFIN